MASPCTSEPIGQRRYSRNESGRRNVASANSANAKGELPIDMDAHLLRDLGPRVVHDDYVALPILRCLVPAQGALVLVRDRGTVLARLWNLDDHTSPFLPGAAFRSRAVLVDPVEFAEGGLAHRESDLRLPRRPFVQGDRDDPRPDLIADAQVALRVLPDEPLSLFVHVDPLDPLVHETRRGSYWFHLFITLRRGSGGSRFFWGTLRSTREQESDSSELCERPSSTFLWAFGLT